MHIRTGYLGHVREKALMVAGSLGREPVFAGRVEVRRGANALHVLCRGVSCPHNSALPTAARPHTVQSSTSQCSAPSSEGQVCGVHENSALCLITNGYRTPFINRGISSVKLVAVNCAVWMWLASGTWTKHSPGVCHHTPCDLDQSGCTGTGRCEGNPSSWVQSTASAKWDVDTLQRQRVSTEQQARCGRASLQTVGTEEADEVHAALLAVLLVPQRSRVLHATPLPVHAGPSVRHGMMICTITSAYA